MDAEEKIKQLETSIEKLSKGYAEPRTMSLFSEQLANNSYNSNEELEVSQILKKLWAKKWYILVTSALLSIAAVFYALSLPNVYRSSILLMPNSQEQSASGLAGLAGQFGGLASLAGINIGGGGSDKTDYALEVIESREFLYKFIEDNQLKLLIMAVDGWDRNTNAYSYDPDIYDPVNKVWVRDVSQPFKPEPSIHETYETFLKENLSISQNKDNSMVTIAINHVSPYLATSLVQKLVTMINETVKQQDLEEAISSIEYLEQELETTREVGMQTMFYQLIEKQQQTLMLAKVRSDYVLKVVDKAVVPEQKFKPKRSVIVFLGALLGAMISSALILIFSFKERRGD